MLDATRFKGLGVALATPFYAPAGGGEGGGDVDLEGFRKLVRHVAKGGADYVVVLGSTGEGATVLDSERPALVEAARAELGKKPLVLGTGSNSTRQAAALARQAADLGVDGILVVTPYYNKPQIAGLEAHFRAIAAEAPGLPIIVYNVPGRTGLNLLPKDLARLWAIPQIVAVKESSGNLAQIGEIARNLPPGKLLISGDDGLALPAMAVGASGLISVLANLLPRQTKELVDAALAGRRLEAAALHAKLLPMMDALFLESNPAPLKAALAVAGISGEWLRLPLARVREETRAKIAALVVEWKHEGGL